MRTKEKLILAAGNMQKMLRFSWEPASQVRFCCHLRRCLNTECSPSTEDSIHNPVKPTWVEKVLRLPHSMCQLGSIPTQSARMCSEVSQMSQLWLTITRRGLMSSSYPPCPGAHLTKAHALRPPGCQSLPCNPKSSRVSGKLCLDSRPRPAPLSPTSLCARRPAQRRSHSPRITSIENVALCLPNESLRRINLLFFLSKHRTHYS